MCFSMLLKFKRNVQGYPLSCWFVIGHIPQLHIFMNHNHSLDKLNPHLHVHSLNSILKLELILWFLLFATNKTKNPRLLIRDWSFQRKITFLHKSCLFSSLSTTRKCHMTNPEKWKENKFAARNNRIEIRIEIRSLVNEKWSDCLAIRVNRMSWCAYLIMHSKRVLECQLASPPNDRDRTLLILISVTIRGCELMELI